MLCIRSVKDILDDQEKGSCSYKVSDPCDPLIIPTSSHPSWQIGIRWYNKSVDTETQRT